MAVDFQLILSTCPDSATAERIANTLVEEKLAACVNILPQAQSVYRWRGKVETGSETLVLIKSKAVNFGSIATRIQSLHPYELPEIIAVPITEGSPEYLSWLANPKTAPQ